MIRWNASFVRGLAQSVLERARVVRNSLTPFAGEEKPELKQRKRKSAAVKRARAPRRSNG